MDITTVTQPYAIAAGTYVGDASNNKAVAHGLTVVPKLIIIWRANNGSYWLQASTTANITFIANGTAITTYAVTNMTSTNFYVGNTDYTITANLNAQTYNFLAFP
jgi:hypothetical protein